jgi:DNA-binding LacI/PurR family transcriptional regulator
MPVVALVKSRGVGVPSAAFDNFGAGVMATRHLIECGRKRIAHIAGKPQSWDAQERLRGWRFAMQEGGLPAGDEWIHFGDWAPQGGETGLRQLLDRIPGIDAVFASNDNTALGAMLAAHRLGKRIPEDIAFIGVDDIKGTGWFHPPLTTIRQNRVVMGRQAVRMLSEMIEARFNGLPIAPVSDYLSPPELIIRESS